MIYELPLQMRSTDESINMSEEKTDRKYVFDRKKMMKRIIEDHAAGELDDLNEYFQDLEGKFHGDKRRISHRYDQEAETINSDPELKDQLNEYFSEEFHIIDNVYIKVFRYSVVVGIHSILEVCLNDLCRYMQRSNNLALALDDLKDNGIQRAKSYLTKVCRIDFPINSYEWSEVIKLNLFRNCIIHAQGDVDKVKSTTKLRNTIENSKGISLNSDKYLAFEKEYIETAIKNVKNLLKTVYEKAL